MSGFYVMVTGFKSHMVAPSGGREIRRIHEAEGHYFAPIRRKRLCKEGNEELVPAPKGASCSNPNDPHKIEENEVVYNLGRGYVCKKHYHLILTLEDLKQEYSTKYYKDIAFDGKLINDHS